MTRRGQKFKKYTKELKLQIVHEKINEGKSYTFLAEKYGISN